MFIITSNSPKTGARFSENQSALKLENRKRSPCSPRAPNLLHVLPSRMVGWNELCNSVVHIVQDDFQAGAILILNLRALWSFSDGGNKPRQSTSQHQRVSSGALCHCIQNWKKNHKDVNMKYKTPNQPLNAREYLFGLQNCIPV